MKKALIICLLTFGISVAAKAQCPINDILTTKDPQTIAALIDNNVDCIRASLTQNSEYQSFRVYVDYLYNTSKPWIYHTNLQKEKLFEDFYNTWGDAYPTMSSAVPANPEFAEAVKTMIATDPVFFAQKKETKVPVKYQQWLYVKNLEAKYGERSIVLLANAASKIANLATDNYMVYVSN